MQQLITLTISNTATKCCTKNSTPQYFLFYFVWALPSFICECMKAEGLLPKAQKNSFYCGVLFYDNTENSRHL